MKACEGCGEWFRPGRSYHRRCWDCWREGAGDFDARRQSRRREIVQRAPLLSEATIRNAVQLCHPDRHPGRQELANRTTAELLEALAAMRSLERQAA